MRWPGSASATCRVPSRFLDEARKIGTHVYYHAPVVGQYAACRALEEGDAWLAENRATDGAVGSRAARALGLSEPEGGTFLFMDVSSKLDDRGLDGLLEDAFEAGVLVAPGPLLWRSVFRLGSDEFYGGARRRRRRSGWTPGDSALTRGVRFRFRPVFDTGFLRRFDQGRAR